MADDLLARHRRGDPQATSDLIQQFLPLATEYLKRHTRHLLPWLTRDDLRSQLELDLCVVIGRLKGNDVAADDIERFVRGELSHAIEHLLRFESEDILPKRGEPGEPLKRKRRVRSRRDDDKYVDPLNDPLVETDYPDQPRLNIPPPEIETAEQDNENRELLMTTITDLAQFARTPFEKTVAGLAASGMGIDDIAASMPGIGENQILNVFALLRARAKE